jgi:hypothetical protein
MARISIDTSTKAESTGYSFQRKLWKTDAGKLILFANVSNVIKYKTSIDDGDTWSVWTTVHTQSYGIYRFDTYMDASNNIYLVLWDFNNSTHAIRFYKLTYSSGTWSIGSVVSISTSSIGNLSITKRSNGDIWISRGYSAGSTIVYNISTTDGASWGSNQTISIASALATALIPFGTKIWIIAQAGTKLKRYEYDSSMDAGIDIAASGITNAVTSLGTLKVSDSEIYVAGRTASGIKIYKYTGSWDAGTLLSDNASDESPFISYVNSQPITIWSDYDGTNYDISYRYYNGASWDAQVDLTSDADPDKYPVAVPSDTDYLYLEYTTGSGSPYTIYFDKVRLAPFTKTILSDAKIKALGEQKTITSNALIAPFRQSILSDAKIKVIDIQKTINSDAKVIDQYQETILSDAKILILGEQKTILSDAKIKVIDIQKTINSDAKVIDQYQETILSDAKILILGEQKTILSDAKIVILELVDIISKFNSVKRVLSNINIKFNSAKSGIKDISNLFTTVKKIFNNINNDFRTKKRILNNNINNDIRFIRDWQRPGNAGFQSLGKSYIHVYINGSEQTDLDVDSINIQKNPGNAHTASFDLGRTYDSTKPNLESDVEIKYHIWTLYTGYITEISPAENPETITIRCNDKSWKENQTNVYFNVGHNSSGGKELYYKTIQSAILTEFGWSLDIGNFIPESINSFAVEKSNALTNLIQTVGNYSWYYDINGNKILWSAGAGNIINIERQQLGKNIGLHQLLEHSFTKDSNNIINKYRVQMGNSVTKRKGSSGGSEEFTTKEYKNYQVYPIPTWDSHFEEMAEQTGNYGYNHHPPEEAVFYQDVFRKYQFNAYIDPEIAKWSDKYPPIIVIQSQGFWSWGGWNTDVGLYNFNGEILNSYIDSKGIHRVIRGYIESGFTIDYDKSILTLSDAVFVYKLNGAGECEDIWAPSITLYIWKEETFTRTESWDGNPETEISNPLMFFTDKIGDYPITIMKELNLSNLSIQHGYYDLFKREVYYSWNDMPYAKDYADWQLSKSCDTKIVGSINLTLDALCFYNINLNNRIYIEGITESPMNINSISYNLSNFTVTLELQNYREYKRTESLPFRGE